MGGDDLIARSCRGATPSVSADTLFLAWCAAVPLGRIAGECWCRCIIVNRFWTDWDCWTACVFALVRSLVVGHTLLVVLV
jgi:hypothetical protein